MIKSTFNSLIGLRLGSRSDSDLDALIAAEAAAVQSELERGAFLPWFLYNEDTSMIMSTSVATVDFPASFLAFYDEEYDAALEFTDDDGNAVFLIRDDIARLRAHYATSDAADPVHVYVWPTKIQLFPQPSSARTITLRGYFADTAFASVASDGENNWLKYAHDWFMGVVGERVARYVKDNAAASAFATDAQRGLNRVYTFHTAWLEQLRERRMEG